MSDQSRVHELFACLCVSDAGKAIEFYNKAFGARAKFRLAEPGGRVGHAEIERGAYTVMLAEAYPELNFRSPQAYGGTPVTIHLHVDNAYKFIERAVAAGATVDVPIADLFYGERSGSIRDPFGHRWNIGHHIEEVSAEEMQRRYANELAGAQ
jgi:PhnB protein